MNSRQRTILQMVIDQGQVGVTGLAKTTGVSEVTIRQDLNTFEKLSYLRYAYGLVVSLGSDDVETHMMSSYALKHELAEFATSLVQPGETIFIKNGSSDALFVRILDEQKKDATIITVSSYIVHLLKDAPCGVVLLGSVYRRKGGSVVGPLTRQCIQQVYFSKASIGIDGWQPETGFTGRDMMRTDVVNAVLEEECRTIVLTGSSEFGAVHSYSIGPIERFNRAITDSKIHANNLMHLEHSKLTVRVVSI